MLVLLVSSCISVATLDASYMAQLGAGRICTGVVGQNEPYIWNRKREYTTAVALADTAGNDTCGSGGSW